jgi:hypothetical protein
MSNDAAAGGRRVHDAAMPGVVGSISAASAGLDGHQRSTSADGARERHRAAIERLIDASNRAEAGRAEARCALVGG